MFAVVALLLSRSVGQTEGVSPSMISVVGVVPLLKMPPLMFIVPPVKVSVPSPRLKDWVLIVPPVRSARVAVGTPLGSTKESRPVTLSVPPSFISTDAVPLSVLPIL